MVLENNVIEDMHCERSGMWWEEVTKREFIGVPYFVCDSGVECRRNEFALAACVYHTSRASTIEIRLRVLQRSSKMVRQDVGCEREEERVYKCFLVVIRVHQEMRITHIGNSI